MQISGGIAAQLLQEQLEKGHDITIHLGDGETVVVPGKKPTLPKVIVPNP